MTRGHHRSPRPMFRASLAGAAAACSLAALGCDPNEDASAVQIETRPNAAAGSTASDQDAENVARAGSAAVAAGGRREGLLPRS